MRETVAQLVERETIKVPKSMVRVHPVSLLFLQKGADGCLSNNLTYYYAIRIRCVDAIICLPDAAFSITPISSLNREKDK